MGSSLTDAAITIVGKCIDELVKILQQFSMPTNTKVVQGCHSKQSYTKDMKLLVRQLLLVSEVYAEVPGRSHGNLNKSVCGKSEENLEEGNH